MPVSDGLDQLESRFRTWERERDLSGGVLVTQAGSTLFEGCYGFANRANGSPVTSRTRFGLASVTKMFTAVAVCDLIAGGGLKFDAAIVDILPPARRPSKTEGRSSFRWGPASVACSRPLSSTLLVWHRGISVISGHGREIRPFLSI
jgi:CubicO group peptidase (beta-lactamase class C family)